MQITTKSFIFHRWNQTPLSEAVRFGHLHIASYLRTFIDQNPNQNWESSAVAYEVNNDDDDGDGEDDDRGADENNF